MNEDINDLVEHVVTEPEVSDAELAADVVPEVEMGHDDIMEDIIAEADLAQNMEQQQELDVEHTL